MGSVPAAQRASSQAEQRRMYAIRQRAIAEAGGRANLVAQRAEMGLFQVLYTDFTELVYADGGRKAVLIPIIGHTSKMAYGWAVGESANSSLAGRAWARAKGSQKNNSAH